jgi:hypothetical protein
MDRFRRAMIVSAVLLVAGCTDPGINGRVHEFFSSVWGSPPPPAYTANPEPMTVPNPPPGYAPA